MQAAPATATPVLHVSGGILTGASGVDVGGVLYDVTFTDGTCAAVYDGCDAAADFAFTSAAAAQTAAQALLAQVLLDGPSGNFDSAPALTLGCPAPLTQCSIYTPYSFTPSSVGGFVSFVTAINNQNLTFDLLSTGTAGPSQSFAGFQQFTLADWSRSPAAVPEPASLTLVVVGLAGVGAGYRRTRRQGNVKSREGGSIATATGCPTASKRARSSPCHLAAVASCGSA